MTIVKSLDNNENGHIFANGIDEIKHVIWLELWLGLLLIRGQNPLVLHLLLKTPWNSRLNSPKLQIFLSIIDKFFKKIYWSLCEIGRKRSQKILLPLFIFLLFHFSQFLFAHLWDYSCSCYYCSGFVVIEQINWWHFKYFLPFLLLLL